MIQRIMLLILCTLNIHPRPQCRLHSRTHFREPLPIIIRNGRLLEPTDNFGGVELNYGETLTISCEGSELIRHANANRVVTTATITCVGDEMFRNDEWLNAPARFSAFTCQEAPRHTSRRTNRTCFEGNKIFEVGYTVQNEFYPVYESCFDESRLNAVYSKYTQKPYNAFYQTRVERPFFIAENVYGFTPVETLFSPRGLRASVAQLVGTMIDNYVTKTESLSRGHLAAKTDFVFAFGERATFHYVNCAPQWTGFNGGNWNTLEVDLRNHVHSAGYDTIIYTGTLGVTQLFNQYGVRVDIYLDTDENNNPVIPVPQYYYKVVYEPCTQRGIAYVGINNPYYTPDEARELFFCQDLCRTLRSNFSWLTWHPDNPSEGYTFCCSVPDFKKTVNHLPSFEILCIAVIIIKYIEAGVITGASEIWNNNNIDSSGTYPASNALLEEYKLKKSMTPTKFWMSKNIPLFKKIPKDFAKSVNARYPDTFYKELYGIKKLEEKVKIRLHNMMKSNAKSGINDASLLSDSVEQVNKDIDMQNNEDAVEISLSQDDTTEDTLSNIDQEMEDDSKRLIKDFVRSRTVIPTKSDCHSESSEEKKDLDEFIFILDSQGPWEDVVDDVEMTTQVFMEKPRSKRRVNMIEEENMGSTVSGFKFTGHDMRLSNDLYYKNINS
ncbi:hypothetical protein O3G_MSEX008518 [Manduca sexta]|uniref:DNA/RNA non-specific endonuclease/pyrophosphatase/phosphodiesterase domain-containing protein n=1 Tax=Manduca sexta TaxID=7130 RepID=A0A921ZAL6_MANSE|nr:hypothetical protein O3G_MSEX008518 [Manduca sexta]